MPSKKTIFVIICSLFIAVAMTMATWEINFWPSDERAYYYEAAVAIPQLQYISQIHQAFDTEYVKWLHGKEMFILSCSIMQGLINDYDTIRPLILVCIISLCFASILFFLVAKNYWGEFVGLICFFLFVTSFWPYVYVLFVKHQPLGLFYFLFALFLLQSVRSTKLGKDLYFFSGFFMCSALYSSTVSGLYLPLYLAAFIYDHYGNHRKQQLSLGKTLVQVIKSGVLVVLGFAGCLAYFNFPDIIYNLKSYLRYIEISGAYNHFFYNQPILQQWGVAQVRRAGWLWVWRYFLLIMPVVFPFYLVCAGYVLGRYFFIKEGRWKRFLIPLSVIFLSATPVLSAEAKKVAQYGANYFPVLIGALILIAYALKIFALDFPRIQRNSLKTISVVVLSLVILGHVVLNGYVFLTDVYPTRMVTTFLSKKIKELKVREIYSYPGHPHRVHMVDNLNPKLLRKLHFLFVDNIYQGWEGLMLVPPMTGNSIYIALSSGYTDYDRDIYFNELMRKGNVNDYALASFKTLASSRIWPQEEEILSYRYLILNQFPTEDIKHGKDRVWLLDLKKLQQDATKNLPSLEYIDMVMNGIRNIGTKQSLYVFQGDKRSPKRALILQNMPRRIFKVGNPTDGLRAYVYKIDDEQPVWVPFGHDFASDTIAAKDISTDPKGGVVQFQFPKALIIEPGPCYFVVYRTGKPDDQNFYRIYLNNQQDIENDIKATNRPIF